MKQQLDSGRQQQIVGGDLVCRRVVSLRHGLAEQGMRRIQPTQPVDPQQQVVGHAMHYLTDLTMHVGVQAAEVGHTRGRAHAAEKSIPFDQQRRAAGTRCGHRRRDPGRPAAQNHDLVFAIHLGMAGWFEQGALHWTDYRHCVHSTTGVTACASRMASSEYNAATAPQATASHGNGWGSRLPNNASLKQTLTSSACAGAQ